MISTVEEYSSERKDANMELNSKSENHDEDISELNPNRIDGEAREEGDQPFAGTEYPTGFRFWLVMLALGAVIILVNIDMNIVATAVPVITDQFHTVADVGWYSAAFRLTLCAFQFIFGKVYSLYRIKPTFLIANVIFLIGSVLCATATSSIMFIIGRAVTGLGAAGLSSGILVILVLSTPLTKRPMWLGLTASIEGLSVLCGPLLGGVIVEYAGWRWCFYINLPIGAITVLLTIFCIHDRPKSSDIATLTTRQKLDRVDIISNLILVPSIICLFLALSWGGMKYRWDSGRIIGLFVTSGVLFLAFAFNQHHRGDRAALPPRILRQRSVAAGFIWMTCANSGAQALEYYLPTYFQTVQGYTPAQSGYLLLPLIVLGTIGAVAGGIFTSLCGYYTPFVLAASVILSIAAGLVTTFGLNTSLVKLVIYTALWGLGYGIGFSGPTMAAQTVLSAEDVPFGLSIMLFAQSFGPSLAIVIAQLLFQSSLTSHLQSLPDLDSSALDSTGLTNLLADLPAGEASQVLMEISHSLVHVWYLALSLACASIFGGLLMEWRSVKGKKTQ